MPLADAELARDTMKAMPKEPSDSDILNEISSKLDDLQAAVTDLSKAVADLHGALRHGFAQVNARFDALERRFG